MKLASAPERYNSRDQNQLRLALEQEIARLRAALDGAVIANGGGFFFRSPNGTKYKLTVSDAGAPVVTAY